MGKRSQAKAYDVKSDCQQTDEKDLTKVTINCSTDVCICCYLWPGALSYSIVSYITVRLTVTLVYRVLTKELLFIVNGTLLCFLFSEISSVLPMAKH